jgi:tRNA-dihydrouridine synthase
MLKETGCHAVMIARGALKAPWIAQDYRRGFERDCRERIRTFFAEYKAQLESEDISPRGLLKQSKSVCRFMFDGMEDGEAIRRKFMLTQTAPEFYSTLEAF